MLRGGRLQILTPPPKHLLGSNSWPILAKPTAMLFLVAVLAVLVPAVLVPAVLVLVCRFLRFRRARS